MTEKPDQVLDADGAATLARVGKRSVTQALKAGELEGTFFGGNVGWRTTRSAVFEWLRSGRSARPQDEVDS